MPVVSFRCSKLLQPWKFTGPILLVEKKLISRQILGRVAPSITCLSADASLIADPGVASSIPVRSHTFVVIYHEIISRVILLPSAESFKKVCCQLQVIVLHEVLVNCLFKLAQNKVWLGELTVPP